MGILVTSRKENRSYRLSDLKQWLRLGGLSESNSGVDIDPDKALESSAVFACVNVIANTVSMVPLVTYERTDKGKDRATEHELYTLLHDQPNPEMTSFQFRHMMQSFALLYEGAYALIETDGMGTVKALWPVAPWRVVHKRTEKNEKYFEVTLEYGGILKVPAYKMLEIHWIKLSSGCGISAIHKAREAIGLALASEGYGAYYYKNGTNVGSVIESPAALSDAAFTRLKANIEEFKTGLSNSHRNLLLEEGAKFNKIVSTQEESQYVDTRKFQVEEVARFYNVPLHMINMLDRSTNNNIEAQYLGFVKYTMMPWLVNWEQAYNGKLVLGQDKKTIFVKHIIEGLLRADTATRAQFYKDMWGIGVFSQNMILDLEDMNRIENGDFHYVPLNYIPIERMLDGNTENEAVNEQVRQIRQNIADSYRIVFEDAFGRIVRREQADVGRDIKKAGRMSDVDGIIRAFYGNHKDYVSRQLQPVSEALGQALCTARSKGYEAYRSAVSTRINNIIEDYLAKREAEAVENTGEVREANVNSWVNLLVGEIVNVIG